MVLPVVVQMRDLVTGSVAIIPVQEVGTILHAWLPHVTVDARAMIDRLQSRALSGDWWMVEEHAPYLELDIRPM